MWRTKVSSCIYVRRGMRDGWGFESAKVHTIYQAGIQVTRWGGGEEGVVGLLIQEWTLARGAYKDEGNS